VPTYANRPGLAAFDRALAAGEIDAARAALFALTPDERAILAALLGDEGLARLYQSARRARRGPTQGRVIVLPGLMGTQLDSVDAGGDGDRVWVNLFRIFTGRLDDLRLSLDGQALPPPHTVRTAAIWPDYAHLLLELQTRWQTRPFPFDWRLDIDQSAAALADLVRTWAAGEPAHLLAHSMGGLVARRFIQLYPDAWRSLQDPTGQGRGGRLVMLGTPNRGSFAIVLALSGEEKVVKTLDKIDQFHDGVALLRILDSFHASYQHLPSPRVDLGDDHVRLFDPASWGTLPVVPELIARGRAFQEAIYPVIDADRLLYVAGYEQDTPTAVQIDAPGRFIYQITTDGDGRVPHALGVLEGVKTFWVREAHGDLPKNPNVLAGVHDLLQLGSTAALESQKPPGRGRRARAVYQRPQSFEVDLPAVEALLSRAATAGRRRGAPALSEVEAARLEALMLRDYTGTPLDSGRPLAVGPAPPAVRPRAAGARRPRAVAAHRPRLQVEVVWGDITKAKGDVYAVGHYEGVLPQRAERALDEAVSGPGERRQLVITDQTRRGILRGGLGDIAFFPWGRRVVAVAGMGHAGTFGEPELRRLARNLTWAVAGLPGVHTICTVLIGSGEGTLEIEPAARGLALGLVDALAGAELHSSIRLIRIVEKELSRAHRIRAALEQLRTDDAVASQIDLAPAAKIRAAPGGGISAESGLALLLAAAARASASPARSSARKAITTLLRALPREDDLPARLVKTLDALGRDRESDLGRVASTLRVRLGPDRPPSGAIPTRVSFVRADDRIRVAAITETATVAERDLGVDFALVEELIVRLTDPLAARLDDLGDLLRRLLLPPDFGTKVREGPPLVFEVDRSMARVQWEMMAGDDAGSSPRALGLRVPLARQLRTTYSPPPAPAPRAPSRLRALVVGDPGDPEKGLSLPGARREAQRVADILRSRGVDVVELVGAPDAAGTGPLPGIAPASRIDVLHQLLSGGFDLLHYCGHGDFDAAEPDRAGWVFKGGLLTSRELEGMALAPRLVVANACLSGLTSGVTRTGAAVAVRGETELLPGLADEFFRRGVRDYVGTAWEVSDEGAILFAETFYDTVLPASGRPVIDVTYGQAMLKARQTLAEAGAYESLWAAYQHYGDPTGSLVVSSVG
jgi:pimeloyl-ACP methyl ester carboxylesterase